ncbi:hypothetical protein CS542_10480 [Pedobacter sp. IW39]|nr:hypothetical protein CS542_10480 [Pedobacter sp. IW39]
MYRFRLIRMEMLMCCRQNWMYIFLGSVMKLRNWLTKHKACLIQKLQEVILKQELPLYSA